MELNLWVVNALFLTPVVKMLLTTVMFALVTELSTVSSPSFTKSMKLSIG